MKLQAPPLSLYIHIPWCVRKCPYCDFNSHAGQPDEEAYVEALIADLAADTGDVSNRPVGSIFFGGGTPSLFSSAAISRILVAVREQLQLADDVEITLEANPGTADAGHFAGYRAAGVNRLSIGVQSFDDTMLQRLGRIHTASEAREAFQIARAAGFDNINLDLMYGLPGQAPGMAIDDLRQAIALRPEHLSWYQLTLEPNTAFHATPPPAIPDDDMLGEIAETGIPLLASEGYAQYEVSAYARHDRRCRHNLNYWQFGDYIGIGAGAHGKLTVPGEGVVRRRKERHPRRYMETASAGKALSGENRLQDDDLLMEFMLNSLRLNEGVPAAWFEHRTGLALAAIGQRLALARNQGLIEEDESIIRPTQAGRQYLNDLLLLFS
ncbi:MAG: radical SAM family heme chaperone HemW [Chromatiales bacterium]